MARTTEIGRRSLAATGRTELVKAVGEKAGLSWEKASKAVGVVVEEIAARLAGGDRVVLRGFGTFVVAESGAREYRDLRTGERRTAPPSKAVRFVPSPVLKRAVNPEAES